MWAILGTTKIAESMATAIREAGEEIISVYTQTNELRLNNFADRFQIPHRFLRIEDALSAPGVKAVWVGTPNQAHAHACEIALACEQIDIILSEKSLERDMTGARRIERAVHSAIERRQSHTDHRPLIFREAIFYLNHPIIHKYLSFLQTGLLGDVKYINAEYSRDLSLVTNAEGGGAI